MGPEEIHRFLHEQFAEAISPWQAPQAGDAHIKVSAESLPGVCKTLRDRPELAFDYLRLVTAVDWQDRFSSVYHLYSYKHFHEIVLRVDLDREKPSVPSVAHIWPTADWLERECYDMMGIHYQGHPELERILLPLDWQGYPLRKDYQQPSEYHGVRHDD